MLVAPQFSRIQNREVTTYLVNSRDRGSMHCSIQQAVAKAEPYSRIVVTAGQYFESITVSSPIEIVGEDADMPEICGRGVCLSVAGDVECYFQSLKIVYKGSAYRSAAQNGPRGSGASVRLISGRPTFYQCFMTSVYVGGPCAPTISYCTIQGSTGCSGLTVAEDSDGTYIHNTIQNHIPYCLQVSSRGSPVFEHNIITQSVKAIAHLSNQILIHGGTLIVTKDCLDNERPVSPSFSNNQIRDDVQGTGVATSTNFNTLQNLTSFDPEMDKKIFAERSTVRVDPLCTPTFVDNDISGGYVGVSVAAGGGGTFQGNTIRIASMYGVVLSYLSTPLFRINVISKCNTGIFAEGTSARLSQNIVRECMGSGLLLHCGMHDNCSIEKNTFVGNDIGVSVRPSRPRRDLVGMSATKFQNFVEKTRVHMEQQFFAQIEKERLEEEQRKEKRREELVKKEAELEATIHGTKDSENQKEGGLQQKKLSFAGEMESSVNEKKADAKPPPYAINKGELSDILKFFDSEAPYAQSGESDDEAALLDDDGDSEEKRNQLIDMRNHRSAYPPILSQNVTSHNRSCGISVMGTGFRVIFHEASVQHNGIFGAVCSFGCIPCFHSVQFEEGPVGLCSEKSAQPFLFKCDFYKHSDSAVVFRDRGRGLVRGSVIHSFARSGIAIDDGGNPIVEKNMIGHSASGAAIRVRAGGIGRIISNRFDTVAHGVVVTTFGDPEVTDNTFIGCTEIGAFVEQEGLGTFTKNSVKGCGIGFAVSTGGEPTIRDNHVIDASRVGLVLSEGSKAMVEKNTVEKCIGGGLLLEGVDSHSTVRANIVRNSTGFGIRSIKEAEGLVMDNKTSGNLQGGLSTLENGDTSFVDNISHDERGPGIIVGAKGKGHFDGCVAEQGMSHGCELYAGSQAEFAGCIFQKNGQFGVNVHSGSGGRMLKCVLRDNFKGGICYHEDNCHSDILFDEILVDSNNGEGILVGPGGTGTLKRCTIRNHPVGVLMVGAGRALIEECRIEFNRIGAQLTKRGSGTMLGCHFENSEEADVEFSAEGSGTIDSCVMISSNKYGVASSESAGGIVRKCRIEGAREAAVFTSSWCTTEFCDNTFCKSLEGALCSLGTRAVFRHNTITQNKTTNVRICAGADPLLEENSIEKSESNGITIEGRSGRVRKNHVHHNEMHGILIDFAKIISAQLREANQDMIKSHAKKSGGGKTNVANKRTLNDSAGQKSSDNSVLQSNNIEGNKQSGIFFTNNSYSEVLGNEIHCNEAGGIVVCRGASPDIKKENDIHNNKGAGVKFESHSAPYVQGNKIHRNASCNVELCPESIGHVVDNSIYGGVPDGMHCEGSATVVKNNQIIENFDGSGAYLLGPNKSLRLENNEFARNSIGVNCNVGKSSGHVIKNKFIANTTAGVRIAATAEPIIEQNLFDSGTTGVLVLYEAAGLIKQNTFTNNQDGITIMGKTCYTSCIENIFQGNANGIDVRQNEGYLIENNTFLPNTEAGILIEENSNCRVFRNAFKGGKRGVCVQGFSAPVLEMNTFEECDEGASLYHHCAGRLQKNVFHKCACGCVIASVDRAISVTGNCFALCTIAGLVSEKDAAPSLVEHNLFCQQSATSLSTGLLLRDGGGGAFNENDFHENSIAITFAGESRGEVAKALIHNNKCGLLATGRSGAVLSFSSFFSNEEADIRSVDQGTPFVRNCFFRGAKVSLSISQNGAGTFSNNTFKDCSNAVFVDGAGPANVQNNFIMGCTVGISMKHNPSPMCTVGSNAIVGGEVGVYTSSGGSADFTMNYITQCDIGVLIERRGAARISHNTIVKNYKSGVLVRNLAGAILSNNIITENGSYGVHCHYMTTSNPSKESEQRQATDVEPSQEISPEKGEKVENSSFDLPGGIAASLQHSACIVKDEHAQFVENNIHRNRTNVNLASGGVVFRKNVVHGGEVGIQINPDVTSILEGNCIFGQERYGVSLASSGCTLSSNEFYSTKTDSAILIPDGTGIFLGRDNQVYNSCTAHPQIPNSFAPLQIPEDSKQQKDMTGLLTVGLRTMHQMELQATQFRGCNAIPGSKDLLQGDDLTSQSVMDSATPKVPASIAPPNASRKSRAGRLSIGGAQRKQSVATNNSGERQRLSTISVKIPQAPGGKKSSRVS